MQYDIIIVGSGIVGATTALMLAKKTSLKVGIIEAANIKSNYRVSAISLAAKNIFKNLAVWELIQAKRISPYTKMHVWDAEGTGKIDFNCADVAEPVLGYIIEDNAIRTSLLEKFSAYANLEFLCPIKLISLHKKAEHIELITEDKKTFTAKLIIAADGAHSWVREQAGIQLKSWDYEHTAIVATVRTELPHQKTAWQRFLTTGPLAFLPLEDPQASSIVWSAIPTYAEQLLVLDDQAFQKVLADAFEHKLGAITAVDTRYHFPLKMRHAKEYVQAHLALIGDAAHTIHPLAGQGVNLGLLDAACLVEVIAQAINKKRDFSSLPTLRRYERERKSDNLVMLAMVEVLKNLFASEKTLLKNMRSIGLNFTNQVPFLKNFLVNYALGKRCTMPENRL